MRIFAITLTFLLIGAVPLRAQDLDPEKVRQSIDRGVQYLKGKQTKDGNWDSHGPDERCGTTALAVLAMTSCGISKNDPSIQRAMQYMRLFPAEQAGRNYSLSLQTMAFCLVEPDRDLPLIRSNVDLLQRRQVRSNGEADGGWDYIEPHHRGDLSVSQFVTLALFEAERVGIRAKKETWQRAFRFWSQTQNTGGGNSGGWGYTARQGGSDGVRGSMTCAGIASMIISSGMLDSGGATVRGDRILCFQPSDSKASEQIKKGLDWLGRHFSVAHNPGLHGTYHYYYLYALERVGRMTNHRFIAEHDWYREGTDKLLQIQQPMGGLWKGHGEHELVATSFALLFLSKGRRPVLMSKIQYGETNSWNLHAHDINNMTIYAEQQWKQDMTWQVVDIQRATVDHLLQSPVLYLSGNRTPLHREDAETAKLAAKLREYIDQGGFIFAEAQSNDQTFDDGFRKLMKLVFPEPGYELEILERSHPIWTAEVRIDPEQLRPIEGINFGCRTSVVFLPMFPDPKTNAPRPSLSCLWEVARVLRQDEPYSAPVQAQVDAGLGIGLNVLAYATERQLKYKDEIAETASKKTVESGGRRGKIFLTFLDTGGTMNPAPHAPTNLLYAMEAALGVPIEPRTETVNASDSNLFEYPILFMHGRSSFQFTPEQRENLRNHLQRGGFLFVNAICSSKSFADSFQEEIRNMFPDSQFEAVSLDDPLFTDAYGGYDIAAQKTLEMRMPEQSPGRKIVSRAQHVQPRLFGIRLADEDRLAVIFSPDDVSCALEKASSLECRGYTHASAVQLATNVVLYALEHW